MNFFLTNLMKITLWRFENFYLGLQDYPLFNCSNSTIETPEKCVKSVQS